MTFATKILLTLALLLATESHVISSLLADSDAVISLSEDNIQRKRHLMMHRGEGNNTKVFGGGEDPTSPFDPNRVALKLTEMKDADILSSSSDEPSLGQARWAAKHIFQQIEAYDKEKNQEPISSRVFVEFGSRDGIYESNTYWFEKALKWEGLLIDAGRDYMHNLRKQRGCRLHGKEGACVFAALAAQIDKTVYWSSIDQVHDKPNLTPYGNKHGSVPETEAPTAEDRAVKTTTLNHLLHQFGVAHVDFMSCDCEGCEGVALQGLNLDHYHVDVFSIESPNCDIAWTLNRRGYTLISLPFSLDTFFLSPSVVQKMAIAPDLTSCQGIHGNCNQETMERKLKAVYKCNTAEQKLSIWTPQDSWPPGS